MTKFDMDMRRIERSVARLTGDRRGAARVRRELTAAVHEAAVKAEPQIMAELTAKHVAEKTAGWVNDPDRDKAVLVQAGTGCVLLDSKSKPILGPRISYRKTPDIDLGNFVDHLKTDGVEGFAQHMYLDQKGNVTVGIGLLLATAQKAMTLPFVKKPLMKPAHPKHIENAYNKVKAAKPTGVASDFKHLTSLIISEADAILLTLDFIDKIIVEIRVVFPDFDTYPVNAKKGILDMFYTIGTPNIISGWPLFRGAVKRRDWKEAVVQEKDRGVGPKRHKIVNVWFTDAANEASEKFFLDPSCKPLPLTAL
jgi:GH24 family phage-related lysozyme (muramidase)